MIENQLVDTSKMMPLSKAAKRVGVSRQTIWRWARKGLLPARRFGGRWFVYESSLMLKELADNERNGYL